MIWQSIPLMTAFDVLIVTAAIFALGMLARHRRRLRGALLGPAFLVLGLATLAGAYAADLVVSMRRHSCWIARFRWESCEIST